MPGFSKSQGKREKVKHAAEVIRKAPPVLLLGTLASVIDQGAALIFSATRDGGAVVLTLLDGDTKDKVYCENMDDLRTALTDLARDYATEG